MNASRILAVAALAVLWTNVDATAAERPNVIVVMTDDQGYGDVGFHGNTMIRTPRLDAFARQSARFTNFHVDPTCSETRAALMTGRYSCRTGVWHTIMGRSILRRDETTMADVFAASGYRTGIFGKWHLGDSYPYQPNDRGFHESLVHGGGGVGQTPDYWGNNYFDDTYFRNGAPEPQQGYCTDVFFSAAIDFVGRHRQQPFFCYIATNAPHGPYLVDPKYSQPYVEQGVPQPMANFYGMIENIDENFGRLLDRLDEWRLADKTLVIFLTDNGTAAGAGGGRGGRWSGFNAGLRGQKGSQYDGGHRVPCFVRGPGGGQPDRNIHTLAAHFDLLPTMIDVCSLQPPEGVQFDGRSLRPLLAGGEGAEWPARSLVVHSQRVERPEKWRKTAVMTDRWRLVDGRELYDIVADRRQAENVAGEHPQVVAELRKFYDGWWDDVSARFDVDAPLVIGHEPETTVRLTGHDWRAEQSQVPWNQSHIRQNLVGNGVWSVDVAQAGRYELRLRRLPEEAATGDGSAAPLGAVEARVQLGAATAAQKVPPQATEATLTLDLPAGPAQLKTWLTAADGKTRGAFYVYARRITTE